MDQKRWKKEGPEGLRSFKRPVWVLLRFLAGTTLTAPKLEHFTTCIQSACPQVWRGQREDTGNNEERGVNSSLLTPPPAPLLLFTALWFLFDWRSSGWLLPPTSPLPYPANCTPTEVFMGRPTGCWAHQEIKVSSSSTWAAAHCDLFNSSRVNITDACEAEISAEELDDPQWGRRSVSFLLPSKHTHKIQAQFPFFFIFISQLSFFQAIILGGLQKRGLLNATGRSQLLASSEQFQEETDDREREWNRFSGCMIFKKKNLLYCQNISRTVQLLNNSS